MSEIQQKGSRTKLYYKDNPADPKEGKSYIEVEDHYLAVIAAVNTAYGSEYVALVDPVTAEVTYVRSEDIAFAFADSSIASDTWITYVAGDDLTRRKVDNHLLSLATSTILYDYDGNAYKYVRIGSNYWMIQDLRTTHYANGDDIPHITDDAAWLADTTGAYCWYENDAKYKETYGALYNWYAVDHASVLPYFTNYLGVQNAGWRVPTRADYDDLVAGLGGTDDDAGGFAKEMGYEHWDSPNAGATDTLGFRTRGNGNRHVDTESLLVHGFINAKVFDDKWTSEAVNAADAYSIYSTYINNNFEDWSHEKYGGMAVRCCKTV